MDRGMSHNRIFGATALLFQVFLMMPGAFAGTEDCIGLSGNAPILCYECSAITPDHFCGDPFNKTHPELQLLRCKEYCVKWTRSTLSGKTLVQRTCSSKLSIGLRKTSVCIEESRPSQGTLCFCDKEKCNTGPGLTSGHSLWTCLLLAFIINFLLTTDSR